MSIGFFFDGMPAHLAGMHGSGHSTHAAGGFAEQQDPFGADDTMSRRETLELVRAYYRITDEAIRKRVLDLIKSMGPAEP